MAGIADLLESDGSKALLLIAVVATVLFTDIVRSFLGHYSLQTKVVLLGALLALLWIFYSDVGDGDDRGMTTFGDLLRPIINGYQHLREWWQDKTQTPARNYSQAERGQLGLGYFVVEAVRTAVKYRDELILFAAFIGVLHWTGIYPAPELFGDTVVVAGEALYNLLPDPVQTLLDGIFGFFKQFA